MRSVSKLKVEEKKEREDLTAVETKSFTAKLHGYPIRHKQSNQ
jgi:hypothetical protein